MEITLPPSSAAQSHFAYCSTFNVEARHIHRQGQESRPGTSQNAPGDWIQPWQQLGPSGP